MKNLKALSLVTVCFLLLSLIYVPASAAVWDGTSIAAGFSGGDGTEANPFIINTPAELAKLAADVNDGTSYTGSFFRLNADIDLGGKNWTPIGNAAKIAFRGSFDGCGHTVTGLTCVQPDLNYAGLFGLIIDATVQNLTVSAGEVACQKYTGVIIGSCNVTPGDGYKTVVYNCHVEKADRVLGSQTGGVIGRNSTTGAGLQMFVTGCSARNIHFFAPAEDDPVYNEAANFKNFFLGGIIGCAGSTVISGCWTEDCTFDIGNKQASTLCACGGIIGVHGASSAVAEVYNCYVANCEMTMRETVPAALDAADVGGIVGRASHVTDGAVKNCWTSGITYSVKCPNGIAGTIAGNTRYWTFFSPCYTTDEGDGIGSDPLVSDYPVEKITKDQLASADFAAKLNEGNSKAIWEASSLEGHPVINVDLLADNECSIPDYDPLAGTITEPAGPVTEVTQPVTAPADTNPVTEPETQAATDPADEQTDPATEPAGTEPEPGKKGCGSVMTAYAAVVSLFAAAFVLRKKR